MTLTLYRSSACTGLCGESGECVAFSTSAQLSSFLSHSWHTPCSSFESHSCCFFKGTLTGCEVEVILPDSWTVSSRLTRWYFPRPCESISCRKFGNLIIEQLPVLFFLVFILNFHLNLRPHNVRVLCSAFFPFRLHHEKFLVCLNNLLCIVYGFNFL